MTETAVVALLAGLVLGGAITAVFVRHVLYAIIGLGICLLSIAGLFLFLGSPFVAAMQVLIYVGGISVAMVFALMLSASMVRPLEIEARRVALACAAGLAFCAVLASQIMRTQFPQAPELEEGAWAVERIGHGFLTTYNVVFEGLSLVLLVAIIGAIIVAKKEEVEA